LCCWWWAAWASSPASHIWPVPAGSRQRRADRQRHPQHLEPAAVRSHAITRVIAALCQGEASRRLPRRLTATRQRVDRQDRWPRPLVRRGGW
jgi:hypothetical protein